MQNEIEAELRGRLVVLETLLAVAIARLAELASDPSRTIVAIMANAEAMLEQACNQAAAGGDEAAADFAREAFDQVREAMQQHIAKRAEPHGSG